MANVFISHASSDKGFVKRLAMALLAKGFPVWLDSWEMSSGDSLLNGIYEGIENSSVLVLVMSESSVASGWVDRELNAAIMKEEQIGRTFVIPVLLDGCKPPLKVADRIYEDFSTSFSQSLQSLCASLEKRDAKKLTVEASRELVALSFTDDVNLDKASLRACLKHLNDRQATVTVDESQVVVSTSEKMDFLYRRLHERIDNIGDDSYFSPDLEDGLRSLLEAVLDKERKLRKGVAMMLENSAHIDAVFWFCRILRGAMLWELYQSQNPDACEISEHGKSWSSAMLISNGAAETFFEATDIVPVDMWPGGHPGANYHFWIPRSEVDIFLDGMHIGPDSAPEVCSFDAHHKFILPQAMQQFLNGRSVTEIPWSLKGFMIGLH